MKARHIFKIGFVVSKLSDRILIYKKLIEFDEFIFIAQYWGWFTPTCWFVCVGVFVCFFLFFFFWFLVLFVWMFFFSLEFSVILWLWLGEGGFSCNHSGEKPRCERVECATETCSCRFSFCNTRTKPHIYNITTVMVGVWRICEEPRGSTKGHVVGFPCVSRIIRCKV